MENQPDPDSDLDFDYSKYSEEENLYWMEKLAEFEQAERIAMRERIEEKKAQLLAERLARDR